MAKQKTQRGVPLRENAFPMGTDSVIAALGAKRELIYKYKREV